MPDRFVKAVGDHSHFHHLINPDLDYRFAFQKYQLAILLIRPQSFFSSPSQSYCFEWMRRVDWLVSHFFLEYFGELSQLTHCGLDMSPLIHGLHHHVLFIQVSPNQKLYLHYLSEHQLRLFRFLALVSRYLSLNHSIWAQWSKSLYLKLDLLGLIYFSHLCPTQVAAFCLSASFEYADRLPLLYLPMTLISHLLRQNLVSRELAPP